MYGCPSASQTPGRASGYSVLRMRGEAHRFLNAGVRTCRLKWSCARFSCRDGRLALTNQRFRKRTRQQTRQRTSSAQFTDLPMAIFGHSMGALIAYEVACRIEPGFAAAPTHLFVSGQRAPHLESDGELSYLSPAPQFLDKVKRLNGTASAVFEHPELVDFLLPILRADFAVAETYTYRQSEPLNRPLTVLAGWPTMCRSSNSQAGATAPAAAFACRCSAGSLFSARSEEATIECDGRRPPPVGSQASAPIARRVVLRNT